MADISGQRTLFEGVGRYWAPTRAGPAAGTSRGAFISGASYRISDNIARRGKGIFLPYTARPDVRPLAREIWLLMGDGPCRPPITQCAAYLRTAAKRVAGFRVGGVRLASRSLPKTFPGPIFRPYFFRPLFCP